MSSVCLLVIHDGRQDYLERTLASAEEQLPPFDQRVTVDDSDHKLGFAGAIQLAWRKLLEVDCDHVFHLEGDFTFTRPVPVDDMARLLNDKPYLAQVALRRQPVGAEIPFGGFMEQRPGTYFEYDLNGYRWVEHSNFFTTNPSLYRRELCTVGWPDAPDSEGHFGFKLKEQGLPWGVPGEQVRFGFWGGMEDGRDWVHHIGEERAGFGY